jgi:cytochrome P450
MAASAQQTLPARARHAKTPWPRHRIPFRRLMREGPGVLLEEALRAHERHGDFVEIRLGGPFSFYVVSDPAAVEEVLVEKRHNFIRGEKRWTNLRRALGDGLIVSDGDLHRRQRRLIQPAFNPRRVKGYTPVILEMAERCCVSWEGRRGEVVDVNAEMMRLTMFVISKVLFGVDLTTEAARISRAVTDLNEAAFTFDLSLNGLLFFVPTRANRRLKQSLRYLDALVERMLAEHRRGSEPGSDVLSQLMAAELPDRLLRDEIVGLFGAGHETTANMLTWTWMLLSQHREVEECLHAELDTVLGGRAPRHEDLPKLVYTERVMRESMRLYPPVWGNQRVAQYADEVQGRPVPAGAQVSPTPFLTQRDARWFPDPLRFDPERFTTKAIRERPRFSYYPFGGGERVCVGQSLAEVEGLLILATLAQRFAPRLLPDHRVELEPMVSLRPRGGMPMRLQRR